MGGSPGPLVTPCFAENTMQLFMWQPNNVGVAQNIMLV